MVKRNTSYKEDGGIKQFSDECRIKEITENFMRLSTFNYHLDTK